LSPKLCFVPPSPDPTNLRTGPPESPTVRLEIPGRMISILFPLFPHYLFPSKNISGIHRKRLSGNDLSHLFPPRQHRPDPGYPPALHILVRISRSTHHESHLGTRTRNPVVHPIHRVHHVNNIPPTSRLNPAQSCALYFINSRTANDLHKIAAEKYGHFGLQNGQKRSQKVPETVKKRKKGPPIGHDFAPSDHSQGLR
jgi:hypothetical protein